ncbi:MAG: DEAD/DEAH box helicase family protein, partial [Candidatus Hydrothermales bacterium]
FTMAGLRDNLEFNVELRNPSDYEFALRKFNELWEDAVDVSEKFVQILNEKTWLKSDITPYKLYLKFLYEYFKDELNPKGKLLDENFPENFKRLAYQEQAVLNAKKILEEYGGVFISDVVGLGKTYTVAMLISQLDGKTIVIAPPALLNENNPGSWPNVFSDFNIRAKFVSTGKLEEAMEYAESEEYKEEYKNIVIDESHRFRNESTISYEKVSQICRGKRVILVSATPYNNSPRDILNQIKLFQPPKKSNIPGIPDLEAFFKEMERKLGEVDRSKNYKKYLNIVKDNARRIRNRVLRYIMVR